ncbi:MAG: hypothetical protein RLZZ216_1083 [Cyanobacteriota bacterium]
MGLAPVGLGPLGLAPGLSSLGPSCRQAPAGIGPVAAPLSAPIVMATLSAAASPFCRIAPEGAFCSPEEDPFLLLESSLKAIERILQLRRGLPLRRTWIEQPYGEEEITILEEEVIPAIQQCLKRVDELDERLLAEQELLHRCQLEADREALSELRLQMA